MWSQRALPVWSVSCSLRLLTLWKMTVLSFTTLGNYFIALWLLVSQLSFSATFSVFEMTRYASLRSSTVLKPLPCQHCGESVSPGAWAQAWLLGAGLAAGRVCSGSVTGCAGDEGGGHGVCSCFPEELWPHNVNLLTLAGYSYFWFIFDFRKLY